VKTLGLFLLALSAPVAALASSPAAPESPSTDAAAQPAARQSPAAEPTERMICRRTEHTGQRTASRRICRTAAQWRALDR
jgi:hypothetical protein